MGESRDVAGELLVGEWKRGPDKNGRFHIWHMQAQGVLSTSMVNWLEPFQRRRQKQKNTTGRLAMSGGLNCYEYSKVGGRGSRAYTTCR